MKHIHADLMLQYAQDAMEHAEPWLLWEVKNDFSDRWRELDEHPRWGTKNKYRKKTSVILVNGIEVPAPVKDKVHIEYGSYYYVPCITDPDNPTCMTFGDDHYDENILNKGLFYVNREDAAARAKVMLVTKTV